MEGKPQNLNFIWAGQIGNSFNKLQENQDKVSLFAAWKQLIGMR